jgi:hypothetical protein
MKMIKSNQSKIQSNAFLTRSTYSELMNEEGIDVQDLPASLMKIVSDGSGHYQIQTSIYSKENAGPKKRRQAASKAEADVSELILDWWESRSSLSFSYLFQDESQEYI